MDASHIATVSEHCSRVLRHLHEVGDMFLRSHLKQNHAFFSKSINGIEFGELIGNLPDKSAKGGKGKHQGIGVLLIVSDFMESTSYSHQSK
jgi:UTP:GlnB (protein PII) uridylyltransferase